MYSSILEHEPDSFQLDSSEIVQVLWVVRMAVVESLIQEYRPLSPRLTTTSKHLIQTTGTITRWQWTSQSSVLGAVWYIQDLWADNRAQCRNLIHSSPHHRHTPHFPSWSIINTSYIYQALSYNENLNLKKSFKCSTGIFLPELNTWDWILNYTI